MRRSGLLKFIICSVAIVIAAVLWSPHAYAYEGLKGNVAAQSKELDRSLYVDAARYANMPSTVEVVRIGLQYGEGSIENAQFINDSGAGYAFGEYDDERVFHEKWRTDQDNILLSCVKRNEQWRLIVISVFDNEILYTASSNTETIAFVPLGEGTGCSWFRGNLYCGGFECTLDHDYLIRVVNVLGLEDYVKGVVPYEMSNNWPYEALRAQAVCARTYVVYNQNKYEEYGFDLTDDTESQVYRGILGANELTDQAVDATAGEYVRYHGEICEIYYFASDGGASEDGRYMFESDRPYLLGKVDPFEQAVDYSYRDWEEWLTGENLGWLLRGKGYDVADILRVEPEYSMLGNAVAVNLYDTIGRHVRITGRDAYTFLLLNNCRYSLERAGEYFWFHGSGWGHNCGLSQWGARAMASVYGYDYQDIIRFYFTGAYAA